MSIVREFRPREVWEGIPVPRFEPLRAVRAETQGLGLRWANVRTGDRIEIDGVEVIVRHPDAADWERQRVRNDDSIVIELRWHEASVLLTGDIGKGGRAGAGACDSRRRAASRQGAAPRQPDVEHTGVRAGPRAARGRRERRPRQSLRPSCGGRASALSRSGCRDLSNRPRRRRDGRHGRTFVDRVGVHRSNVLYPVKGNHEDECNHEGTKARRKDLCSEFLASSRKNSRIWFTRRSAVASLSIALSVQAFSKAFIPEPFVSSSKRQRFHSKLRSRFRSGTEANCCVSSVLPSWPPWVTARAPLWRVATLARAPRVSCWTWCVRNPRCGAPSPRSGA